MGTIAPIKDESIFNDRYLNLGYDGPGSGMYRFLGRCNPQVARLWVNMLPSWIPQVGCCAPDS